MDVNPVIGGRGFHHIGMAVSDFEKSMAFYTDLLGFGRSILCGEMGRRAIMLDCGGGNFIELFEGFERGAKPEGVWVHLAMQTDDCLGAVQRLRGAGVRIESGPTDCPLPFYEGASVRIAFFRGPDGESIELYQQLT